jgi:hypothetical protein
MPNLKLTFSEHFSGGRFRLLTGAVLLAMILVLPLATTISPADGKAVKRALLGKGNMKLEPNCGTDFRRECTAEGKITGYQALSKTSPGRNFVVPFAGKIVSWSIKLARPTRKEVKKGNTTYSAQAPFLNSVFGSPAQARIAVLKQVEKKKKGSPRYKMVRQSPIQVLNPYFGTTVQFALSTPLNVIKNQVVGLTIPTWAPAMWKPAACNASSFESPACQQAEKEYTWRGSRASDKCNIGNNADGSPNEALAKSRPQQKIDSVKKYGCYYGSNVLLYTATIIGEG